MFLIYTVPMTDKLAGRNRLTKRLMPLYISIFFQSFVLWYAIEKLFMRQIGFTDTTIGLMISVYSIVMLAVETPGGILADRWSRKGVLIIASLFLAAGALVGGLSNNVEVYLISAALWGVFFALYSGIYDSIVYDLVVEETGDNKKFEKIYGRVLAVDSVGLVLAGLVGGFIASNLGLRQTFFWTIPFALIPIIALMRFQEPSLNKKHINKSVVEHIKLTIYAVLRRRDMTPLLIALIVRATMLYVLFEFCQLWFLALDMPTKYYGIANAVILASIAIGALSASRLALSRFGRMSILLIVMMSGLITLIVSRNLIILVLAQLVVATCLEGMFVILNRMLHDRLDSNLRAGAASATNTVSRFIIVPLALIFGYVSHQYSIFTASYILLGLGILLCGYVVWIGSQNKGRGLYAKSQTALIDIEIK